MLADDNDGDDGGIRMQVRGGGAGGLLCCFGTQRVELRQRARYYRLQPHLHRGAGRRQQHLLAEHDCSRCNHSQ